MNLPIALCALTLTVTAPGAEHAAVPPQVSRVRPAFVSPSPVLAVVPASTRSICPYKIRCTVEHGTDEGIRMTVVELTLDTTCDSAAQDAMSMIEPLTDAVSVRRPNDQMLLLFLGRHSARRTTVGMTMVGINLQMLRDIGLRLGGLDAYSWNEVVKIYRDGVLRHGKDACFERGFARIPKPALVMPI